jgi:peptidoglycan/LPS O-acetylase OafA/YrhL
MSNKITFSDVKGYVKWAAKDLHKSASFYGFLLIVFAALMAIGGCPAPWPRAVMYTGVALGLGDLAYHLFMISFSCYRFDRERTFARLSEKEKN